MPEYSRTQEIEHAIGPDGRLALRVTSSDLEVLAVDGDTARVRVEFDIRAPNEAEADRVFERVQFRADAGAGSLEVSEPRRGDNGLAAIVRMLGIGSGRVDAHIVAEVPARASLSCAGVSGDLRANGLIGPQEYRTVSGDIVLAQAAGPIKVAAVSGELTVRGVGPVDLRLNSVSGDISAFAPRLENSRLVTVSGDIELEGALAEEGDHRLETVSGDLSLGVVGGLTLEVRGLSTDVSVTLPHRSEGSRDRRRYVIGDGAARLVFSSMSGDVSVAAPRRFSGHDDSSAVPAPPSPPAPPSRPAPTIGAEEQLAILRAVEAGEIDVDEAARRLAGERVDG